MFGNILTGGGGGVAAPSFYPHMINQSLRFNDGDSSYIAHGGNVSTDRKIGTWSGWVKRGNLGTYQALFSAHFGNNNRYSILRFTDTDKLQFFSGLYDTGASTTVAANVVTSQVFRDVGGWYHIVCTIDTTAANSADRVVFYVNGVRVLQHDTTTYPTQNVQLYLNSSDSAFYIGDRGSDPIYYDGYLAETHYCDSLALDASSFGEFKSGVWVPKAYSGSYGTNGFHLDFADGANIGKDVSGNGNDFTATNLAATDIVLDSPTNNFATLNVLDKANTGVNSASISEGGLRNASNTGNFSNWMTRSGIGMSTGKWYCEVYIEGQSSTTSSGVGITDIGAVNKSEYTFTTSQVALGSILGITFDADTGAIDFYKDNVLIGGASLTFAGTSGHFHLQPVTSDAGVQATQIANFGQDSSFAGKKTAQGNTDANGIGDFYYAPPAGYLALCTANLPEPAISPANDASPADHFTPYLWTGNGAGSRSHTGMGFQPDLLIGKNRTEAWGFLWYDGLRGAGASKSLSTNDNTAEGAQSAGTYGYLSSLDADGFSTNTGSSGHEYYNKSGNAYVAWGWKANGAGVANSDGSIASTVSANQESGFSIVEFTGTGVAGSVGHGLPVKPSLVILKGLEVTGRDWLVFTDVLDGTHDWLVLNSTGASGNEATAAPTSTVFNIGAGAGQNESGKRYIAYCWAEVEGFSKFGTYTGNGSADGAFVNTGFRPAFVMVKRSDAVSNWLLHDSGRDASNPNGLQLYPHLSNAEAGGNTVEVFDFLSNGIKVRTTDTDSNAPGGKYVYMAFAENPFKYANAA